jgi:hypothetical protein
MNELPKRQDAKLNSLQVVDIIKKLISAGYDEADVGIILGVEGATIEQWEQRYPVVGKAIEEAKKTANAIVISKLFSLINGDEYEVTEKWSVVENGNGDELVEQPNRVRYFTRKKLPPNTDLLKFYLCNRLHWRPIPKELEVVVPIQDEGKAIDRLGKKFISNKEVSNQIQSGQ